MAETSSPVRMVPRKATECGWYLRKICHALVLAQQTARRMPLDGTESGSWQNRQRVPLRKQIVSDQAEGENMQGHLFCSVVLRQHFNGDIWSLGQKPAAEVASWDD